MIRARSDVDHISAGVGLSAPSPACHGLRCVSAVISANPCVDGHELVVDGHRVSLTQLEFGVMRYLMDHQGKVASCISLESEVWSHDCHGGSNVVDVVVKSLRKKLADQAALIETVHGTGYRLRRS